MIVTDDRNGAFMSEVNHSGIKLQISPTLSKYVIVTHNGQEIGRIDRAFLDHVSEALPKVADDVAVIEGRMRKK